MSEKIPQLLAQARSLTQEPGVYIMKNSKKEIIYIGKAKNLKNRVSSYFRAIEKHTPKVFAMVSAVDFFETIITATEFEALVLECSLIKQHTPKYNILLKDDKGYSYLRIDNGAYPKITEAKQQLKDGATYIGPYMSSWVVKNTADEANKAFALPTCNHQFPRDFKKARPCLNFHLKQCMGVCRGKISQQEYGEIIAQAVDYIKGGSIESKKLLSREMEKAAEELDFEKAARLRDRIRAIERFSQRQNVVYTSVLDQDVIGAVQQGEEVSLSLLKFRGQRLVDKQDFMLTLISNLQDLLGEFVTQYYLNSQNERISKILLSHKITDQELIEQLLTEKSGKKVAITVPQRGEGVKLIELADKNASEQLSQRENRRTGKEIAVLDQLGKLLGLPKPPSWIEAYDISNIGSDTIVGAMTVFEDARPLKSAYKRFNIKDLYAPDDYASMEQMLTRRFVRYKEQNSDGGFFNRLPDLLLIDGGAGHVSAAQKVLDQLKLVIPVFGMVKDDRHRTRAISSHGGEIAISAHRSVFSLITQIQDETHRFAIEYARGKHKKTAFEISLTRVDGIGEARAKALFAHFKTKKAILSASEEDLAKVKGMNKSAAKKLKLAAENGEIS